LKTMGKQDLKPVILNEASNEIPKQYLDASLAQRLLEWKPKYTLQEGLRETISWYEDFLKSGKGGPGEHRPG
jgi:CDP-glucose 4,6-dehydratase